MTWSSWAWADQLGTNASQDDAEGRPVIECCSRRSLWNGEDRTVNNTSEAAEVDSLPVGDDAC